MPYSNPEKQKEWVRQNRDKVRANNKRWITKRPEYRRRKWRRWWWKEWGLNPDQVEQFLAARVRCEICGRGEDLCIDHEHQTGKLRGALCRKCNLGIGNFCDNAALCRKAAEYLERSQ